jgi:hypothetical protein
MIITLLQCTGVTIQKTATWISLSFKFYTREVFFFFRKAQDLTKEALTWFKLCTIMFFLRIYRFLFLLFLSILWWWWWLNLTFQGESPKRFDECGFKFATLTHHGRQLSTNHLQGWNTTRAKNRYKTKYKSHKNSFIQIITQNQNRTWMVR